MMWRTHFVAGIASLWLLEALPLAISRDGWALAASGAMFGALLPDLDASESKIRHLGWKVGRDRIEPFQPVASVINRLLGHRGFLHSAGGWAVTSVLSLPLARLSWEAWLGLNVAFGSHLAADALTKTGIPFWQWRPRAKARRVHLVPLRLRVSTGSAWEEIHFAFFAVCGLVLLLRHLLSPP